MIACITQWLAHGKSRPLSCYWFILFFFSFVFFVIRSLSFVQLFAVAQIQKKKNGGRANRNPVPFCTLNVFVRSHIHPTGREIKPPIMRTWFFSLSFHSIQIWKHTRAPIINVLIISLFQKLIKYWLLHFDAIVSRREIRRGRKKCIYIWKLISAVN